MAENSVGKISLDLDVRSDLVGQINTVSNQIGKNLKAAMSKPINQSAASMKKAVSAPMESAAKAVDNAMKKSSKSASDSTKSMMKNTSDLIRRTFSDAATFGKNAVTAGTKGALGLARKVMDAFKMKEVVQTPRFSSFTAPKVKTNDVGPRVTRGPPKSGNSDIAASQMASIEKEMDLVERRMSTHKIKLKDLRETYRYTFNPDVKNTVEQKIQKEEGAILKLEKSMDSLLAKYNKLESATKSYNASQNKAGKSISNAANTAKKANPVFNNLGSTIKRLGRHSNDAGVNVRKFGVGMGGSLGQMLKWMIILPGIASGIMAMGSSLLASLKTNEQFTSSLNLIKSNLMVAFTPIYYAILPAINALMSALATASGYIASFISLLFGKSFQQSFNDTKSLIAAKDAMGAYGGVAKSAGDKVKAAGKAAKEAQRDILGFDKIEKLSDNTETEGDSGTASAAPSLVQPPDMGALDAATMPWVKKFKNIMGQLFKPFKEAWSAEGLNTINAMKFALNSVWDLVKAIGRSFLEVWTNGSGTLMLTNLLVIFQNILKVIGNIAIGLKEAWEKNNTGTQIIQSIFNLLNIVLGTIRNITGATAEWAARLDFTPLLTSIQRLLTALEPLTANIGAGLEWFWNNVLLPIAGWTIQTAVPTFLDMLSAAIRAVNSVIDALKPLGTWLFDSFLRPLAEFTGGLFISVMKTITDALKKFSDWCSEHQTTIENIAIVIGSFMAAWKIVDLVTTIAGIVGALITFIATGGLAAAAATVLGTAIAFLTSPIGIAIVAIGAVIAIGVLLAKNWDAIKVKAKEVWESIGNTIKSVVRGIANGIKSPVNAIIAILNGLISGVATAVNAVSKMLNNLNVKIPSWVPGIGGKSLGFNIPTWSPSGIPYLAKGGVIDQPTLAMMGEDGKEAVVPLERNRQWIKRVSDEMQRQQIAGGGELTTEMIALLKEIILLLKTLDIVRLDAEALRKYFITATNNNTLSGNPELIQ